MRLNVSAAPLLCAIFCMAVPPVAAAQTGRDTSSDVRYRDLARAIDMAQGRTLQPDAAADIRAVAASGWLIGVYDMMMMNKEASGKMKVCPNGAPTADTMARIYTNYMDAHPETHRFPDLAVAVLSGMSAYPCEP